MYVNCLGWIPFQAFCEPGNVTENGVLAFVQHVIFPILGDKGNKNI